ncbi:hypothetical protein [Aquiflexum sp.]|uniref:hypothetical protein n=1 Tax=Aquiflexum sp. TaxID=1872584 RepID=UPI0035932E35
MISTLVRFISVFIFLIIAGSCKPTQREPNMESLEKYRSQLTKIRAEFGEYELPKATFFLFGMGNREKLLYRDGSLISVHDQKILYRWDVIEEIIIPNDYSVFLTMHDGKRIAIFENEQGVFLEFDGKKETINEGTHIVLDSFEGHPYSEVLKVLNHENLINIDNGLPLPNFFVYRKPWRRDAAMMAMCLEIAGNLDLIKDWVLELDEIYDFNNRSKAGPEYEVDNLGQTLYLISLFTDASHPLVPKILEEAKRWERTHEGKLYLHGRTDFSEMPVYQTKWMKYGLRALGLPDPYDIPNIDCQYSSLFWMDYKDFHKPVEGWRNDSYPYIGWARDHFYGLKQSPITAVDYPLTWEIGASQANYEGIRIVNDNYTNASCAAPHTWHTSEIFLYLINLNQPDEQENQ